MPGSNSTVIFLHIPKTAGTTFHSLLTYLYVGRNSHWTPVDDPKGESLHSLNARQRERLDLLRGHVDYGVHEKLPRPAQYITFLRNPIEHVRSQYRYYREQCGEDTAWGAPIEEILLDDSVRLDNQQVRKLSGIGNEKQECTHGDYKRAIENIKSDFIAVGLTERFDESLILMKQLLGWNRPLFYSSAKVRARRASPGKELRKLILETHQYDKRLYQWVLNWFEKKLSGENIRKKVKKLKNRNIIMSPLINAWRRFNMR